MNTTKIALEASLKELLKKKPFDKITIADLTEDCGISRMAFYYHFKDIYDLVEWACVEDGKQRQRPLFNCCDHRNYHQRFRETKSDHSS